MSYRRRTDANHLEIVNVLRACGWYVCDTHRVPGFFDAIVARRGTVHFVEIKDGAKAQSRQALTAAASEIHADFQRAGASVKVLRTVDEALTL